MNTATLDTHTHNEPTREAASELALVMLWYRQDPRRRGEVAIVPRGASVLGRGTSTPGDPGARLTFARHRPGDVAFGGPLNSSALSRVQLVFQRQDDRLHVSVQGRRKTNHNGRPVRQSTARVGDTLLIDNELVVLVTKRPSVLPRLQHTRVAHGFGLPDASGMVGESPACWALRDQLAFIAARSAHALIHGPSGSGKEICARALHGLSERRAHRLVSRNAATLPEGLIDAELFGNSRNYPNPGMAERPGLIGAAHGSTLFLDEIGEMPEALQTHLLRVLDTGEYQRLGEARVRQSDLRLVGATNRDPSALKHDLLARMKLRVEVPGLDARPEDLPHLMQAVLERIMASDDGLAQRFQGEQGVRATAELVAALSRHQWSTHVRELERLLWVSLSRSTEDTLQLTEEMQALLSPIPEQVEILPEQVQAALDRNQGNQAATYKELGLSSRNVLYRLIKKHGLVVRRTQDAPEQ